MNQPQKRSVTGTTGSRMATFSEVIAQTDQMPASE